MKYPKSLFMNESRIFIDAWHRALELIDFELDNLDDLNDSEVIADSRSATTS